MAETTTTAVAIPVAKKRKELLNQMSPELRSVAEQFDDRLAKGAAGMVLIKYDLGVILRDVIKEEETYGARAVELLAAYRGEKATTLYALRDFANSFDRQYVIEWSLKPMADGNFMTEKHWMVVRQLVDRKKQEQYLNRALKDSLSANDLAMEITASGSTKKNVRSGGRKAAAPTSPLAGLQKFGSLAQSLFNYEEQQMAGVFSSIDEMAPDAVTEIHLERLKSTKENVEKVEASLAEAREKLDSTIARVETVLEKKAEAKAEAKAKEDDGTSEGREAEKPTKKKAEKPGTKPTKKAKPSANGEHKKKSTKPQAATV